MTRNPIHFIAHARLKDIVGRGLINDDNVALIELIKNGKDAGSKRVKIQFSNAIEGGEDSKLIIQDFGHGMTLDDIQFKWLNIAYSDKKNKTKKDGPFAGHKGIGRFSCDRLGKALNLYTRTSGGKLYRLEIDWTKFEVDGRNQQIGTIDVQVREINDERFKEETELPKFAKGTVLVIRDLRSHWPHKRLIALRKELERFALDPEGAFKIELQSDDFSNDKEINGEIENRIFEKLDFRTTSIKAVVTDDGKEVAIELRHDGEEVFSIREKNPYAHLKNIRITLFFLNQTAKAFFRRQTGYRSIDFGSIFLFLNGFRVLPYGNESDDWLALDARKQQGTKRFLSTRDVVGYIEIEDTDDQFRPVSSREGLVHNDAYTELTADEQNLVSSFDKEKLYGLFHKVFRKLERFVVEGLNWDRINEIATPVDEDHLVPEGEYEYLTEGRQVIQTLIPTITVRTPRAHILDLKVNIPYVIRIAQDATASYDEFVQTLEERFEGTSVANITPAEKRDLSRFIKRQVKELAARDDSVTALGRENEQLLRSQAEAARELAVEQKRRLFAEFESTVDQKRIIQLHHQIALLSGKVFKAFDRTIRKYRENSDSFTKETLFDLIERSVFDIDKIRKVSKFASKASFDVSTNKVTVDLIQFVQEYLEEFNELGVDWNLKITFANPNDAELVRSFRPIELSMLIDNLIDNAGKADARALQVIVGQRGQKIWISFTDNGHGLPKTHKPDELFHGGVSTTSGSGIGLKHAQRIVEEMDGRISIMNNEGKGATVKVEFSKS